MTPSAQASSAGGVALNAKPFDDAVEIIAD
jgi:hypothetical protein